MEQHCDIIILAAGTSSRLGSPKQLLEYNGTTLLQHTIETALASLAQRVVVVLGAHAAAIQPAAQHPALYYIVNHQWQEGIASSIRAGLQYLLEQQPAPQNGLLMVCDQPHISTELLDKLVTLQKSTGKAIVASEYAGTVGIPAIFNRKLFPQLLALKGDAGAKKLVAEKKDEVVTLSFPLGTIDIDTAADYQQLQKT